MTVEIAIMNRDAVVLATDSAVTVTGYYLPQIYNSANKVFMLSDNRPVGIMFYGNVALMGVGWETLVKLYRTRRRSTPAAAFSNLKDYSEDFIKFVNKEAPDLVGWPTQEEWAKEILHGILSDLSEFISEYKDEEFPDDPNEDDLQNLEQKCVRECESRVEELLDSICRDRPLFNSDRGTVKIEEPIRSEFRKAIEDFQNSMFGFSKFSKTTTDRLIKICEELLSRKDEDDQSGLVIAGFGEDEVFPSLVHYTVWGYSGRKLCVELEDQCAISLSRPATIYPCAQTNMIDTFFGGIDPDIFNNFSSEIPEIVDRLIEDLVKESKFSVVGKVAVPEAARSKVIEEYGKIFSDRLFSYCGDAIGEIYRTIAVMPKEELAAMAEALVNVSSLKIRATGLPETVGGHADVAAISKGDGFVWIKRKNQISLELNPHLASTTQVWETVSANPLG